MDLLLARPLERAAKIRFQICQERGYYGCNAVLEPVKFGIGKGKMQLCIGKRGPEVLLRRYPAVKNV